MLLIMAFDAERHELEIQIGDALTVHGAWIDQVVAIARGAHAPEGVEITMREDACTFGQWLNGSIRPSLRNSPKFWLAKARHATFHRHAAMILNAAKRNDPSLRAMVGSATAFGENAKQLRATLHDWMQLAFRRAS